MFSRLTSYTQFYFFFYCTACQDFNKYTLVIDMHIYLDRRVRLLECLSETHVLIISARTFDGLNFGIFG